MSNTLHPTLYLINTRVWLTEISRHIGRRASLDDITDEALDALAAKGFDWIWLLSVWQTGQFAQAISRTNAEWRGEFEQTLHDLSVDDVAGSGFAIQGYRVHSNLGGDAALARLRKRLHQRGLRLMLDFVPNHMAPDHPWVTEHPDYFVLGSEDDLARAPSSYLRIATKAGPRIIAHGRDPYFPGWPDTVQLNYGNPQLHSAMVAELSKIARQCDGVRCDMAMLLLPDVFQQTWNIQIDSFWPKAIRAARQKSPKFLLMAEVYWGRESDLQSLGFDYCYDKCLYDRLRSMDAGSVREHLGSDLQYQNKLARFLENHDEPRVAATFCPAAHEAAAVITFLSPGLKLLHQGQFEGRQKRISPHLVRAPVEPIDDSLVRFYDRLMVALQHDAIRTGLWRPLECSSAWEGNESFRNFLAWEWLDGNGRRLIVAVNYSMHQGQCFVRFPLEENGPPTCRLQDLLSEANYLREGADLAARGLYLDIGAWQYHVFQLEPTP